MNNTLGTATGFIVELGGDKYLITNWHVVSGRDPNTGQVKHQHGGIPDSIAVHYLKRETIPGRLEWSAVDESLIDTNGNPMWLEHPQFGRKVDVIALRLRNAGGYQIFPYSISKDSKQTRLSVSDPLSIIGFPFGRSAGGLFGVWLKGSIASEPIVDYQNLPCFLIDARTRQGQSGSPVISYYSGGWVPYEDGISAVTGELAQLQGVYSGRINEQSDIGIVWKKTVINEIITGSRRGNNNFTESVNDSTITDD